MKKIGFFISFQLDNTFFNSNGRGGIRTPDQYRAFFLLKDHSAPSRVLSNKVEALIESYQARPPSHMKRV